MQTDECLVDEFTRGCGEVDYVGSGSGPEPTVHYEWYQYLIETEANDQNSPDLAWCLLLPSEMIT